MNVTPGLYFKDGAKAQAEISFKAGEEQATEDNYYRGYALGRKAGIKEVVEWINSHCDLESCNPEDVVKEWQAQKKEGGIEEKK